MATWPAPSSSLERQKKYHRLTLKLGRAVDYAGLTASFRAHVNIVFFTYFTYLLDNEFGSFFRPIVTESTEAANVTDIFTLKIVIQS